MTPGEASVAVVVADGRTHLRGDVREELEHWRPETVAHCLLATAGTVSTSAPRVVDGYRAIVLRDAGDEPGTSPGELHVAPDGPPRLLRLIASAPRSPGPSDPRCTDADDRTMRSDIAFGGYDAPIAEITAPPDAIDLAAMVGGAMRS